MIYETPEQYELRTMPEIYGDPPNNGKRPHKQWHMEQNRIHRERMETDEKYRQDWIAWEAEYQDSRNRYHDDN